MHPKNHFRKLHPFPLPWLLSFRFTFNRREFTKREFSETDRMTHKNSHTRYPALKGHSTKSYRDTRNHTILKRLELSCRRPSIHKVPWIQHSAHNNFVMYFSMKIRIKGSEVHLRRFSCSWIISTVNFQSIRVAAAVFNHKKLIWLQI